MPTIKFLRDTLNFGDALIRKLCTFNDMFTKRRQGGQFQPQHRRCFTCKLVQTQERRVYAIIGSADKQTKSRCSVVSHKKIRDDRILHHGFFVLLQN